MRAKDIMTTAVVTARSDGTVSEAVRLMLDHHVSGLPVVDPGGKLVGLISEGDLLRRVRDATEPRRSWWLELIGSEKESARNYVAVNSHHIADVMTREVVTVEETTPIGEIARLLERKRIKRVPVVRDGNVVGIVSRSNLLQALAHADVAALPPHTVADEDLRARVIAALEEVPTGPHKIVNVMVSEGRVSLSGITDSDSDEKALRVAAENVPGVREVDMNIGRFKAWAYGI